MKNQYRFNVFFLLKETLKNHIWFAVHQILLSLINALNPSIFILMMRFLVDELSSTRSIEKIRTILLFYIIYYIISNLYIAWQQNRYIPKNITLIKAHMSKLVFQKIIVVDYKDYDNPNFYNLYQQAIKEADTRSVETINDLRNFCENLIGILTLTSIMVSWDFHILVFAIINIALSVLFSWFANKPRFLYSQKRIPILRKIEYIKRIFYMQQYGKEHKLFTGWKLLFKIYDKETIKLINTYNESSIKLISYNFCVESINIIMQTCVIFYLVVNIMDGLFAIGDFMTLLTAYQQFKNMLSGIFNFIPKIKAHGMYIEKLREFLDYESYIENSITLKSTGDFRNIIVDGAFFGYENNKLLLHDINLSIDKGEKIAIVGHNGTGKSTLIKLLLRIYDPSIGSIYFNNCLYNEYNIQSLRKHFGVVFQDFQCYSISIAENILMHEIENEKDEITVWDSLEAVGLKRKIMSLKNTINTILTKEFDNDGVILSGGELQKLAIARALATKSDIIIMDEPTSSLDVASEYNMFKNIFKMYKDKTMIIISHRLNFTKLVDKIYYMEKGRIIEKGNFDKLMKDNGKYFHMYKLQES